MRFTPANEHSDEDLEINMTPLIDIVFLLLIFFMVTTTFIESRGIKVTLPEAASAPVASPEKQIEVSVKEDGSIFFGSEAVAREHIGPAFENALAQGALPSLVLRADRKVEHGLVVEIMDAARRFGVERLNVATVPN